MDSSASTGGRRVVPPMTADRMTVLLDGGGGPEGGVLVIDCRSFVDFNAGHIATAHNVHCPPIVRRRCGRRIPLENLVRCTASRDRLLARGYGAVVAYDDRTRTSDDHGLPMTDSEWRMEGGQSDPRSSGNDIAPEETSSNLRMVLDSLLNLLPSDISRNVFFLNGGFKSFSKSNERLVVKAIALLSNDSSHSLLSSSSSLSSSSLTLSSSRKRTFDMTSFEKLSAKVTGAVKVQKATDISRWHFVQDRGDPTEVLPWLYIGNAYHAIQEVRLRELGIVALLNVADAVSNMAADANPPPPDTFCLMNLPIADSSSADIICKFPQAIDFIENVRLSGGKVLVHCLAGVSRSPAICTAYLMHCLRLSLDDAYDFLKARRQLISPNLNFMRQLAEFETILAVGRQREGRIASSSSSSSARTSQPEVLQKMTLTSSSSSSSSTSSSLSSVSVIGETLAPVRAPVESEGGVAASYRKRPRPSSLSFAMTSSSSVPMTPCTKQAGFGFDFSSVSVGLKMSPTVSHSPLLSPI